MVQPNDMIEGVKVKSKSIFSGYKKGNLSLLKISTDGEADDGNW